MRSPNLHTETALLSLQKAAATHCQAIKSSLISDTYTCNNLVNCYIKCRKLNIALKLFGEMYHRDTSSWNTIIAGHVNSGDFSSSWEFLKSMKRDGFLLDGYTFGSMLKGIALSGWVVYGQLVHSDIVKMGFVDNVYASSSLLDMYAKCGNIDDANNVFKYMKERNKVSWNALIAGYAELKNVKHCIELIRSMEIEGVGVDDATFAPVMPLLDDVDLVKQFHAKVMKRGLVCENTVINATITAYADCGCVKDAKSVFDSAEGYRDLVTWNSMLAAYLEHNREQCGFGIFQEMVRTNLKLDAYSYSSVISACSGDAKGILGKSLQALVVKKGFEQTTQVSNALIYMYLKLKNRSIEDALKVFNLVVTKDHVTWNTVLTGLSQNGHSETALMLFLQMHLDCLIIDQYAFAAALRSCSDLATLNLGQQVHGLVLKSGVERYEYVASALIFMYSKCGVIEDVQKSFDSSCKNSSVTWNSIIFAYAQQGQGEVALDLFYLMHEREVEMDHVTFVAAITACSHIGLVDEGLNLLNSMETKYKVRPKIENYACAVDLLGRAGRLTEAERLVSDMPVEPDVMVWKTMLGACRVRRDVELATRVARHLLELDPEDHCTYVLLSDMYSHLHMWDEKANVKRLMREKGIKKVPAWSWIELQCEVHAFNADDVSHPYCREIYQALDGLMCEIRMCRHGANDAVSVDLDDMELVNGYLGCS